MAYYLDPITVGIDKVSSLGDGYIINISWFKAYPTVSTNRIIYNIYYSVCRDTLFSEGVKLVSIDNSTEANIINMIPGQLYFFSVRPVEYNPSVYFPSTLPVMYDNLRYYPSSLLRQNMGLTDLTVPLLDSDGFPTSGIVKLGAELINYSSVSLNDLILTNINQRGYNNTNIRIHNTDGYDGYITRDPFAYFYIAGEELSFDRTYMTQSRFEFTQPSFTITDGYRQVTKDLLTTDLSISDQSNIDFPMYDYAGYHRTDPVQLLNGTCVGSYIGGEYYCLDAYGVGRTLRGMSVQEQNNQRQEMLLTVTGRPAVLIKRQRTGIVCPCYIPASEHADDRCPLCYGTKFIFGYEQYFYPRRSDGRIMVRVGTADEDLRATEGGLESEFSPEMWTLTSPTIKDRDIIVLFDQDDNEEFRYEVLSVTRNNMLTGLQGGQKMKTQRIRKYDPAYQIRIFRNTSEFPSKLNTTLGTLRGGLPHTHEIVLSEKILSVAQINQTTSIVQGHNHPIQNGEVVEVLGHTHQIIL